jgi:diaminopropionate ammonia-lyase
MSAFVQPVRIATPLPFFTAEELSDVARFYAARDDAAATPLRRLPGLAAALGAGEILIKDESHRFGLPAFKIAGARYAVARLIAERGAEVGDLACATAGNHGRAVARVAREHARPAHVYVNAGTRPASVTALRREGADVIVCDTGYDATVERMARDAAANGWTVVSDTAATGDDETPRWIMAGYTQIFEEAAGAWGDAPPDVVIAQAGVGSFAGALAGWLIARYGDRGPRLVIAEPAGSACVLASLDAGHPVTLAECAPTAMAGLRSGVVSPLAWPPLRDRADAAIAVDEAANDAAVDRLARPADGDPVILAGPSGACGVTALVALESDQELAAVRRALALPQAARYLAFVTEGRAG